MAGFCVFDGDASVAGQPGALGAHDLNLMVRKDKARGTMRWLPTIINPEIAPKVGQAASTVICGNTTATRLFLSTGPTAQGQSCSLARWDALLVTPDDGDITITSHSPCCLMEIISI